MNGIIFFKMLLILSMMIIIIGLIGLDFNIKKIFDKMIVNHILRHPEKFDFEIFDLGQNDPHGKIQNVTDFKVKARLGKFSYNLFWTRSKSINDVKDLIKEEVEKACQEKVKKKPTEIVKVTLN